MTPESGSEKLELSVKFDDKEVKIVIAISVSRAHFPWYDVKQLWLKCVYFQEENKALRQASVHIQAKAEQEEEFISNTLLKKIQALKKEKESLALNYEQEEEMLTNDLSRKLNQLRQEKVQLEHTLEQEQECLVNKLMRKIEKLETETSSKQTTLDQLRREKVQLENTLEQEQEGRIYIL